MDAKNPPLVELVQSPRSGITAAPPRAPIRVSMWADTLAKGYPYTHAAKTMSQVDLQLIADRQRTVIISGRGLDPKFCRLFIVDGAKALSKVIRRIFGAHTPIQRCQIHKARNVTERLPKPLHASVRRALRQAWELDDADKAERLLRNLARRLEQQALGSPPAFSKGSTRC